MSENNNIELFAEATSADLDAAQTPIAEEVSTPNASETETFVGIIVEETTENVPIVSEALIAETIAAMTETAEAPQPQAEETAPAEPSEYELIARQNKEQFREALNAILAAPFEEFSEKVDQISLNELSLVMEELSGQEINKFNIRKIGKLKKRFDHVYQAELTDLKQKPLDDPEAIKARDAATECSRRFSASLAKFNKRKADFEQEQQKEKESNSAQKRALLDQLKSIVHAEDFQALEKVREIQEKWKAIGQVLQQDIEDFYQTYKVFLDQFYAQRTRYNQGLEQDRKINLQKKESLIEEVKGLIPTDLTNLDNKFWQEAGDRVKALHEKWKAVGPVPKAQSDELWRRFKDETDRFYEFRRAFFETLDEQRVINEQKKRLLLAQLDPYINYESDDIETWREASKVVKGIQDEWRSIGQAPLAVNAEITETFNNIVNGFFAKRSNYFKELDSEKDDSLQKKQNLLDRAEALKDSEEWAMASDILKQLQKEWADAGSDSFKEALKLKKRFRKACDHFFKRYKDHIQGLRDSEENNLKLKNEWIEKLEKALEADSIDDLDFDLTTVKQEFDAIGRVPIKQKDKMLLRFRKALEVAQQKFGIASDRGERRGRGDFRRNEGGGGYKGGQRNEKSQHENADSNAAGGKNDWEERKLAKKIKSYEELIGQYENNILFISAGKSGDRLRKEIESKIQVARDMKVRLEDKMKQFIQIREAAAQNPEAEAKLKELESSINEMTDGVEETHEE